jgi:hypothetical protein
MNEKRAFWIIATVVALAGISAAVAYFVTRYLRAQTCEELLDDYCDCDYALYHCRLYKTYIKIKTGSQPTAR